MAYELEEALGIVGPFGRAQTFAIVSAGAGWGSVALAALITPFITMPPRWRFVGESSIIHNSDVDAGCTDFFSTSKHLAKQWEWVEPWRSLNADLTKNVTNPCGAGKIEAASTASAFFFGVLLGAAILARLADRYGRKPLMVGSLLIMDIGGILCMLAGSFPAYNAGRLLAGFGSGGLAIFCFILPSEMVGQKYRGRVMVYTGFGWCAGCILLAVMAFLIGSWRSLTIWSTLPGLALLVPICSLHETPAWLLARNRHDDAEAVLLRIAQTNGVADAKERLQVIARSNGNTESQSSQKKAGFEELVRAMPRRLTLMCLLWISSCLGYYGISLGVGDLGDNIYATATLAAIVEIPSYPFSNWIVETKRFGRRGSLFWTQLFTAIACILSACLTGLARTVVAMIGKFSVGAAFIILFLYGAELFPAEVRSMAMGAQSTSARVGAIVAPMILNLPSPMAVFGFVCAITLPAVLLVPETLNKSLPVTMEEADGPDILSIGECLGYKKLVEEEDATPSKTPSEINLKEHRPQANVIGSTELERMPSGI